MPIAGIPGAGRERRALATVPMQLGWRSAGSQGRLADMPTIGINGDVTAKAPKSSINADGPRRRGRRGRGATGGLEPVDLGTDDRR